MPGGHFGPEAFDHWWGKKKGGLDARLFIYFNALRFEKKRYFFSGAIVIFTVSPELPGKPVNIASTSRGTR